MQRRSHTDERDVLPTLARSGRRSPFSSPHAMPPRIPRPLLLLLVLGVLGLLVVSANFVFTWRATSASLARAEEHLAASLRENPGAATTKGTNTLGDRKGEDGNGGQNPLPTHERDEFSPEDVQRMEKQLVYTIHQVAQRTTEQRGIVLPLFDGVAALGLSLIMELRAMSVDLPIEVPHCGDLKESLQRTVLEKEDMGVIRFYDVCELASQTASTLDASRNVFCQSLRNCHRSYRSFDVKRWPTFSQFEEIMLLDADLFFESPMSLWDTDKYRNTGTLFFHDRLSQDNMFLGNRVRGNADVSELNQYISRFDVS
ncbi:hypothetical protein PRIC2_009591, partial [Phytophthora ramorum]